MLNTRGTMPGLAKCSTIGISQFCTVLILGCGGATVEPTVKPTVEPAFEASITIAGGDEVTGDTTVKLALSAQGAATVEIGEQADLSDAKSLTFAATISWTLSKADGPKTLYARFANSAGDQSEIVSDDIALDTTAPTLTVDAPAVSGDETVRLEVTVVDATEVVVTVDGVPVTVTKGAFFVDVELPNEGVNSFVVVATDVVEHETAQTVEVTLDTIPPVVTIDTPEDGALVGSSPVAVTGTVEDATDIILTVNGERATVAGGQSLEIP